MESYDKSNFSKCDNYADAADQYNVLEWSTYLAESASMLSGTALKMQRSLNPNAILTSSGYVELAEELIKEMTSVLLSFGEVMSAIGYEPEDVVEKQNQEFIAQQMSFLQSHIHHVDIYHAFIHSNNFKRRRKTQNSGKGDDSQ